MSNLGWSEILIIAMVFVLLFGAKKLPDTARAVGRSLRIFKAETTRLRDPDPDEPPPALSLEEQARRLEEQAAKLRADAQQGKP